MRLLPLTVRQRILASTTLALVVVTLWAFTRPVAPMDATGQTSATAADDPVGPALPLSSDVAKSFKSLRLVTKKPVSVDPFLAGLCRGVTPGEIEKAKKRSGPHAMALINIYMNDLAQDAFDQSRQPYPVGSVIVKEKGEQNQFAGVGGMIKRPPGYDPANGDWEYFFTENASALETGKIASCVQCHRGASSRDYVFADWANRNPRVRRLSGPQKP